MKTINFELSKQLNEKWLLDDRETEYVYEKNRENERNLFENNADDIFMYETIKTLTLEEAIEFLPPYIYTDTFEFLTMWRNKEVWKISYYGKYDLTSLDILYEDFSWVTLLIAIEKMIKYLLKNDLLWQKQENK